MVMGMATDTTITRGTTTEMTRPGRHTDRLVLLGCAVAVLTLWSGMALADAVEEYVPPAMRGADIVERRGSQLDLDVELVDAAGQPVALRSLFESDGGGDPERRGGQGPEDVLCPGS